MNLTATISRSKNKLIILLLLFSTWQAKAQDYIPMLGDTNVWTYAHWPWEWVNIVTTDDSVYNNVNYKKILHQGWGGEPYGLTGLIREDSINRQVWYIEPDSLNERIIYDFSLAEGDSIWLQWNADAYGSMLQNGWYYVDSIRIKTFFETDRKVFYLDNPLNEDIEFGPTGRPYIEWIEGVGSNLHPTYFVIKDCAADMCGIMFINGASIICAFKNGKHIYQDCFFFEATNEWTCYGPTEMVDISEKLKLKIFPNPANNKIFVETEASDFKYNIVLQDLYGNTVLFLKTKNKTSTIDISDLTPGVYLISISNKNYSITKKIIKL